MVKIDGILELALDGQRLSCEQGLELYHHADIHELGEVARMLAEQKHGTDATFILNRYLNYSNICILNCQFCSFARKKRDSDAFEYSIAEMVEAASRSLDDGITEIHIVGGLHPTLGPDYYLSMLRELKSLDPNLMLKCFTAVEIFHLANRVFKKTLPETLALLRDAGLSSLTGGGAEILDDGVRDRICRGKESSAEWIEAHRQWHRLGGKSTCTMLYGHVETPAQRLAHMHQLRLLQDETGGFTGFIPYAFEPENNELSHIPRASSLEELRTLALSRIMLDNIPNLTAYWISTGLQLAQISLSYGVNDLHGTIEDERIFHMAGAKTPVAMTRDKLSKAIREAGKNPVQRDTYYRPVQTRH